MMPRQTTFGEDILHWLLVLVVSATITQENETLMTSGLCSFTIGGHYYSLKSLARLDGQPRFQADKQGWNYGYNPCAPFTFETPCVNVAACRWDNYDHSISIIGLQSDVKYQMSSKGIPELVYSIPKSQHWFTIVNLKCNPSRKGVDDGILTIIHDTSSPVIIEIITTTTTITSKMKLLEFQVLQVEHNCCCPDACPDHDANTTKAPHRKDDKPYSVVEGVIGGFAGLILIIAAIIFIRKKLCNAKTNNDRLLIDCGQYGALGYRDPDDDAPDPDVVVPDPEGHAQGPEGEDPDADDMAPDPDDVAPHLVVVVPDPYNVPPDPDVVPPDPDVVHPDPDNVPPDPDDVAPDPDVVHPDPDNVPPDPDVVAPDPDVVHPDPDDVAPNLVVVVTDPDVVVPGPEGDAEGSEGEDSDPDVVAPNPDVVVPTPEGNSIEPEGDKAQVPIGDAPNPIEASDHGSGSSVLANMNRRGESPHLADFVPYVPDTDLPYPVEAESSLEEQCCEEESSPCPKEPIEYSFEHE